MNDFDIFSFYAEKKRRKRFNWRSHYKRYFFFRDFGQSKFGVHPKDAAEGYTGRTIDYFRRSIPFVRGNPVLSVRNWLVAAAAPTPKLLATRPLVCLWPNKLRYMVIWNPLEEPHTS